MWKIEFPQKGYIACSKGDLNYFPTRQSMVAPHRNNGEFTLRTPIHRSWLRVAMQCLQGLVLFRRKQGQPINFRGFIKCFVFSTCLDSSIIEEQQKPKITPAEYTRMKIDVSIQPIWKFNKTLGKIDRKKLYPSLYKLQSNIAKPSTRKIDSRQLFKRYCSLKR